MKAAVVIGLNDIRIRDIPEPSCGQGEVKIKVAYCGICGSDIPRVLKGTCHSFPQVLGHEFSGHVAAVGEGVQNVAIGDPVVGAPLIPCFMCEDCAKGDYSLCNRYSFVGSRQQGAMAEYVVLPAANVVKIDPSVLLEKAALTEPSTVALHGVLLPGFKPQPEDWVAVIGMGPIGLFSLEWVRILGAKHIVVIGHSRGRLPAAIKYGATAVVSSLDADFIDCVLAMTEKRGCAYVYDAVGTAETTKIGMKLLANKGKMCMIGTPTNPMSFGVKDWELINRHEMTLTGSWMSYSAPWPGVEWVKTVSCLKSGELMVGAEFMADIVPIDNVREIFNRFANNRGSVKGRVILRV